MTVLDSLWALQERAIPHKRCFVPSAAQQCVTCTCKRDCEYLGSQCAHAHNMGRAERSRPVHMHALSGLVMHKRTLRCRSRGGAQRADHVHTHLLCIPYRV